MKLTYPRRQEVPQQLVPLAIQYAHTYIVLELLRLKHNEEGERFRLGEISQAEWQDFRDNWFETRSDTVIADLLELREQIKQYAAQLRDNISLEDIPT